MPLFTYEASTREGQIKRGEIELPTKEAVLEHLEKKNLIPVAVHDKAELPRVRRIGYSLSDRVTAFDRILLVRNLGASIRAGLNIVEALDLLMVDSRKRKMREILASAKNNLLNGRPLSDTFATYRKYFPPMFVGMVRAGEASGQLDATLDELGRHLSKDYDLRKKIRSALAYPILLLAMSFLIVLLLLLFVLPRLATAFQQSRAELPLFTKIILGMSNFLTSHVVLDVVVLAFLVWFFAYFRRTDVGTRLITQVAFRIPVIRDLIKKIELVRFTRTLASLIASGTSFLEALRLCSASVSNTYYREAILKTSEQMQSGVAFSKAIEGYPDLFPRFMISLIVTGERTGTLEHTLKTFADFYDEEVDYALKDFVTFLEPALLLIMGGIIGSIALSVLLPVYELVKNIS